MSLGANVKISHNWKYLKTVNLQICILSELPQIDSSKDCQRAQLWLIEKGIINPRLLIWIPNILRKLSKVGLLTYILAPCKKNTAKQLHVERKHFSCVEIVWMYKFKWFECIWIQCVFSIHRVPNHFRYVSKSKYALQTHQNTSRAGGLVSYLESPNWSLLSG